MKLNYPTKEEVLASLAKLYPSTDLPAVLQSIPGVQIFAYGGILRDLVFEKQPTDADILIVNEKPITRIETAMEAIQAFERKLASHQFTLLTRTALGRGGSAHYYYFPPGTTDLKSVIDINVSLDLRQPMDVNRRPGTDFSINGLYFNLSSDVLSDPHHGLEDLERKILRAAEDTDANFNKHYPYLFRAIKCACQFNLTIDPATKDGIKKSMKGAYDMMNSATNYRQSYSSEWALDNMFRGLAYNPERYFELHKEFGTLEAFHCFMASKLGIAPLPSKAINTSENPFLKNPEQPYEHNLSVFLSFFVDRLTSVDPTMIFTQMVDLWGFNLLNRFHHVNIDPTKLRYIKPMTVQKQQQSRRPRK